MRSLACSLFLALAAVACWSCASDPHQCTETCCPNCCPKGSGVAAAAAAYEGRDGAAWARAAEAPDGDTRQESVNALAAIGPVCLCRAVAMLDSPDAGLRSTGAEALRRIGPEARPAAPRLGATLQDRVPAVKVNAARALAALDAGAASEIPALVEALDDEEWAVRYYSVVALGHSGWKAYEHRAELTRLEHRDRDPRVRRVAFSAREQIDEDWYLYSRGVRKN